MTPGSRPAYPGETLGLPASGPGSLAPMGLRVVALLIDWLICYGLAALALGFGAISKEMLATSVLVIWFVLGVVREESRKWDWTALLIDVDPDELKNCACEFPALFYVHPKDYRPGPRRARQRWFRIPGKHRNIDAAWDALNALMATRH